MLQINITIQESEVGAPIACMKIAALLEIHYNSFHLYGEITPHEVKLTLATLSYQDEILIAGKWNEETEEMIALVWHENQIVSHFNFHPMDSMGGFDLQQFKEEIKKINQ